MQKHQHPDTSFSQTGRRAELDAFIPSLAIGFEHQGAQHYRPMSVWGNFQRIKQTDAEKRVQCKLLGITLIEVPYWWSKTRFYLEETIAAVRPDLIQRDLSKQTSKATQLKPKQYHKISVLKSTKPELSLTITCNNDLTIVRSEDQKLVNPIQQAIT
jgi:hypothetical protein